MIEIFNSKKLLKTIPDISLDRAINLLTKEFSLKRRVNIIFVDQEKIKDLNRQYRKKDYATDVLSFHIGSREILGEVYICPKYVKKNIPKEERVEEIIRLIIHGILHLQGYEHDREFKKVDYKNEPMYIRQEEILNKILKEDK
jgi:probable rRNA maturation factor